MAERSDPFLPSDTIPGNDLPDPVQVAQATPPVATEAQPPIMLPAPRPALDSFDRSTMKLPELVPLAQPQMPRGGRTRPDARLPMPGSQEAFDKELSDFSAAIGAEKDPGESVGRLRTMIDAAGQGVAQGFGADIPKAVGIVQGHITGVDPNSTRAYQLGGQIDKFLESALPTNPKYRSDLFTYVIPNAVGQVAGTIGSYLTGAGFARLGLGLGAKGVKVAGRLATTPANFSSMGVDGFEDAVRHGAKLDDAFSSFYANGVLGATEFLPITRALGRADDATGGLVSRTLARFIKNPKLRQAGEAGIDELFQEPLQQIGSNLIASGLVKYDPNRKVFEGVPESGIAGFSAGSLYGLLFAMLPGRQRGPVQAAPYNPNNGATAAPPGSPQLPPPGSPPSTGPGTNPNAPNGPDGLGSGTYFQLPPPPSNVEFLKSQITRLEQVDANLRASDSEYLGDTSIGSTIQFFRYLEKSEADFERLRAMSPVERQTAANEILAKEVAANRELVELLKDPIRMVSRPTYVLQQASVGTRPGKVIPVMTDADGNPILKRNGAWVATPYGDKAVGKGRVRRIDSTQPENLALGAVGQKMLREARDRMAADRARVQAALDAASAEARPDKRKANRPGVSAADTAMLEPPVQLRPDSAPGPMQTVEDAAMASAGENQTRAREDAQQRTAELLTAASAVVRGNPGKYIEFGALPGDMQTRIAARAIMLGRPKPEVLTKEDLTDAGVDPRSLDAMFARRQTVQRLVDRSNEPQLQESAIQYFQRVARAPLSGRGVGGILKLFGDKHADPKSYRLLNNILRAWQKSMGRDLDATNIIDWTAWMKNDAAMLMRAMPLNGSETAVFIPYLRRSMAKLAKLAENTGVALGKDDKPQFVRDVAHELTHLYVHVSDFDAGQMSDLWSKLARDAAQGTLTGPSLDIFNRVARDYAEMSDDLKGEEFIAFTVENMLMGRYQTREDIRSAAQEPYTWADRVHDFIAGLYRFIRDAFDGVLGRDAIKGLLKNIERTYDVDFLNPAPPANARPSDPVIEAKFARRVDPEISPFFSPLVRQWEQALADKSVPASGFGRDYAGLLDNWARNGVVTREELQWTRIDGEMGVTEYLRTHGDQRFAAATLLDMISKGVPTIRTTQPFLGMNEKYVSERPVNPDEVRNRKIDEIQNEIDAANTEFEPSWREEREDVDSSYIDERANEYYLDNELTEAFTDNDESITEAKLFLGWANEFASVAPLLKAFYGEEYLRDAPLVERLVGTVEPSEDGFNEVKAKLIRFSNFIDAFAEKAKDAEVGSTVEFASESADGEDKVHRVELTDDIKEALDLKVVLSWEVGGYKFTNEQGTEVSENWSSHKSSDITSYFETLGPRDLAAIRTASHHVDTRANEVLSEATAKMESFQADARARGDLRGVAARLEKKLTYGNALSVVSLVAETRADGIDEQIDKNKTDASDAAYRLAEEAELDNAPYIYHERETGYEIRGNDDMGYSIHDPDGKYLKEEIDLDDAKQYVINHAFEHGYVEGGGGSEYASPEDHPDYPAEVTDEQRAQYQKDFADWEAKRMAPGNVRRGPKWQGYMAYNLAPSPTDGLLPPHEAEIVMSDTDYRDTLITFDDPSVPVTEAFVNKSHFEDKNVLAFFRHARVILKEDDGQKDYELGIEAQSDWWKRDIRSRAAARAVEQIDRQINDLTLLAYRSLGEGLNMLYAELGHMPKLVFSGNVMYPWGDIPVARTQRAIREIARTYEVSDTPEGRSNLVSKGLDTLTVRPTAMFVSDLAQVLISALKAPIEFAAATSNETQAAMAQAAADILGTDREFSKLEPMRERAEKFASAKTHPAPYVGSEFDKVGASYMALIARYHLWTAVKEGRDGLILPAGIVKSKEWGGRTFTNMKVELNPEVLRPSGSEQKDWHPSDVHSDVQMSFKSLFDKVGDPDKATVEELDKWAEALNLEADKHIATVTYWNDTSKKSSEEKVRSFDELKKYVGSDIFAALRKKGLFDGKPISLRAGVDLPQTYFLEGDAQSSGAGYRVLYDIEYPNAFREIWKKMKWGEPVFRKIKLHGEPATILEIPEAAREFFAKRGDQSVPLFGMRFARRPGADTQQAGVKADPNLKNDPDIDQMAGGITGRYARRTADLKFDAPGKAFEAGVEPQPEANIARGKAALQEIKNATISNPSAIVRVKDAMYRKLTGWISFIGNTRVLSVDHVSRRPERVELTDRIPEIVANGVVGPAYLRPSNGGFYSVRRNIVKDGEVAVIASTYGDKREPFLLTARPKTDNPDDAMFDRSAGGVVITDAQADELIALALKNDHNAYKARTATIVQEAQNVDMPVDVPVISAKFARQQRKASVPPTFSALYKSILETDRKASRPGAPEAWTKEALRAGAKEAEIKWSGLRDWLKANRSRAISKDEVLDFLRKTEVNFVTYVARGDSGKVDVGAATPIRLNASEYAQRMQWLNTSLSTHLKRAMEITKLHFGALSDDDRIALNVALSKDFRTDNFSSLSADGQEKLNTGLLAQGLDRLRGQYLSVQQTKNDIDRLIVDGERVNAGQLPLVFDTLVDDGETGIGEMQHGTQWTLEKYNGEMLEVPGARDNSTEIVFSWQPGAANGIAVTEDANGTWAVRGAGVSMSGFASRDEAYANVPFIQFKSVHWDKTDNPLMHVRYNTRKTADGKSILFIEEIQSDWHNRGRANGYYTPISNTLYIGKAGVPDAPLNGGDADMANFVLKNMIRRAVDEGHSYVAWTPGRVQATRYNLDMHVGSIEYVPVEEGTAEWMDYMSAHPDSDNIPLYYVRATDPDSISINLSRLSVHGIDPRAMTLDQIAQVFGPDISRKVKSNKGETGRGLGKVLTGLDLKVDDKPKRDLYDTTIGNVARKLAAQFKASVVPVEFQTAPEKRGKIEWAGGPLEVQAIEINDAMRDAALDIGFARFARRGPAQTPPPPTGPSQGRSWFDRMVEWIGANDPIFTQTSQRIRAIGGTRAAYQLGNEFRRDIHRRTAPGRKDGIIVEDYHGVIQGALGKFVPRLSDMLAEIPESARLVLADVLRGKFLNPATGKVTIPPGSGLTAAQAQRFRNYLNEVLDFANDHMQGLSQFGAAKGTAYVNSSDLVSKIANYFPQQWRIEGTFGDETPHLKGADRTAAAMEFFKAVGLYAGQPGQMNSIREMINNINGLYGFVSYASSSIGPIGRSYQLANSTLSRVLNIDPRKVFQINVNGQTVDVTLSDFLDNDPAHVLLNYTSSMVRYAEWVRRFGPKGEVIDDYMAQIDKQRVSAGRAPLTPQEQSIIVDAIQSNVGGLKRPNATFDAFQQWVQVGGNALYLSLSTLTSVPELVMPAVRLGMTGQLYAFRAGLRSIFTASGVSKDRQFARELGVMHEDAHIALQNAVVDYGDFRIQKWNQRLFSAIGLNIFTRLTQTMAVSGARYALPGWGRRAAAGSAKHVRWLAEVGLTANDLAGFDPDSYVPGTRPKIDAALRQMAGEMVINPTHAAKAGWMNDPRFRLVSHIKSYMWGFNNTVLQRVGAETVHGNLMPLIFLIATVAMAGAISDLREWLVYGEEGNPALNKLRAAGSPEGVWRYSAAERGGLFGPLSPLVSMMSQTRAGSSGTWAGTLVPAIGIGDNVLKVARGGFMYAATQDPKELRLMADGLTRLVPGAIWTGSATLGGPNRTEALNAIAPTATQQRAASGGSSNPRGVSSR